MPFSDYIVYVDESGSHEMKTIDPQFPVFGLVFCIFQKADYVQTLVPQIQQFKFKYFGHDMVILHGVKIRRRLADFAILNNDVTRADFVDDLNRIVSGCPYTVIAGVIRKDVHKARYVHPADPYHIALEFGLDLVGTFLGRRGQTGTTDIVVEQRGGNEDAVLRQAFYNIRDGRNSGGQRMPFRLQMVSKLCNSTGLQL